MYAGPLGRAERALAALPILAEAEARMTCIVRANPREPDGIERVTETTREDALAAAVEFQKRGMPIVTIVADGRVYTIEEFALTIINDGDAKI